MYNRYIPRDTTYEQVTGQSSRSTAKRPRQETHNPPKPPLTKGVGPLEWLNGGLDGLLENFHLNELDSGDILLLLILLFLFMESDDNLELVITLGLLLAFGLFGKEERDD